MTSLDETYVRTLAQDTYATIREALVYPPGTNLSAGNRCDLLTLHMFRQLEGESETVRRELHEQDGLWHYVVALSGDTTPPGPHDQIIDMNPWQYDATKGIGPLCLPRHELQDTLAARGAPEWFIALRGIDTIRTAHTLLPNPYSSSSYTLR